MDSKLLFAPLALSLAMLSGPAPVHAHGEADESVQEFHEHIDDYRGEIDAFVADIEPIVAAYRDGDDVQPMIDGLIERWEDVAVHGAVETHVPSMYPGIWQGIIGLQQATLEARPAEDVASVAADLEAALWQALGALRLAAVQVESGERGHAEAAHDGGDAAAGPETVDRIIAELDDAVDAYAGGNTDRAEALIHDAYMKRFEYLEGDLIEQDAELVSQLEQDFNATLPLLMQNDASTDQVREALAGMKNQLERARELLVEAEQSRSEVF